MGASVAVKLESQAVVKHPMWVLGAEVGPPGRAMCALNSRGISAAPFHLFVCLFWVFGLRHRGIVVFISGSSIQFYLSLRIVLPLCDMVGTGYGQCVNVFVFSMSVVGR